MEIPSRVLKASNGFSFRGTAATQKYGLGMLLPNGLLEDY